MQTDPSGVASLPRRGLAGAAVLANLLTLAPTARVAGVVVVAYAAVGLLPLPLVVADLEKSAFYAAGLTISGLYVVVAWAWLLLGGVAYAPGAVLLVAACVVPALDDDFPARSVGAAVRLAVTAILVLVAVEPLTAIVP